jgi:predicted MFS family arabinose efflux permease
MRARHVLLAVAAGLALADASVVTLALPRLLVVLGTTVVGVALVLLVYAVALAVALLPAERLQRRIGPARAGAAGLVLFAVASAVCGASSSLGMLLAARVVQAVGGAAALVAAFALLEPRGAAGARGRRLWLGAAVLAAAIGPALGGALTEALSWRWIFYVQVLVALAAAGAAALERPPARQPAVATPPTPAEPPLDRRMALGPAVALALVSAALTAVLFLLVLLLVVGWDVRPLRAALTVTVIPAGALIGARIRGDAVVRAAAGCALVAAGVLALAFMPDASLWWTVAPQAAAGLGMGLALPALGGDLLPERDPRDAAQLLTLRHAGIAVALVALAPVVSHQLDIATERAKERGVAVVLDAKLRPTEKLELAPKLLAGVDDERPRAGLSAALDQARTAVGTGDRPVYDGVAQRLDDTVIIAVGEAFRTAFLIAGGLALLGAAALVAQQAAARGRRSPVILAGAAATLVILPVAYVALHATVAPEPVAIRNPCEPRQLPRTGGIEGFLQDRALELLDTTACKAGSSREELVLALADDSERRRYEQKYGVDPKSLDALRALLR